MGSQQRWADLPQVCLRSVHGLFSSTADGSTVTGRLLSLLRSREPLPRALGIQGTHLVLLAGPDIRLSRTHRPMHTLLQILLLLLSTFPSLSAATTATLVSSGQGLIAGVQGLQQNMALTGFIRPHAELMRSRPVVSVNTTLSASPGQLVLLDTGQEGPGAAPFYVASGVSLLVSGITITNAAKTAVSPLSGAEYSVWFPLFALQPGATLQLEDVVVRWNPSDALEVQPAVVLPLPERRPA